MDEDETEGETEQVTQRSKQESTFRWMQSMERVREVIGGEMKGVMEMDIREFFSWLSYINWKNKELEEKYKRK